MFDIASTTIAAVSTTGDIRALSLIGQGDALNQRDGLKCSPTTVVVNLQWVGKAAAINEVYRTILVRDRRQVASVVPAVLDVLQENSPLSLYKTTTMGRFKVLFDAMYAQASDATISNSVVTTIIRRLVLPLTWTGSTANSFNSNGLFMINISNSTGNQPDVIFTSRILYTDN